MLILKDYEQMEINSIYFFDNLYLTYDGERLFSRYPVELGWHPFGEHDEFFVQNQHREVTKTERRFS